METITPSSEKTTPPLQEAITNYSELQAGEWKQRGLSLTPQEIIGEMNTNYSLLEPVSERQTEQKPEMTICIPVALLAEDQATIDHTLDAINESQKQLGKPVEVILWTNVVTPKPEAKPSLRQRVKERRMAAKAEKRYQELRSSLLQFDHTDLQIKTAFQALPEEEFSISKIRSNYMEAAAINAHRNDYDPSHPVLWLDADITYMTKNTLPVLNNKLRAGKTMFVHADERFTTEWADGKPMSERDPATRAIMIDEIHRRRFAKMAKKQGKHVGYVEESGLGFTLDTYLNLGGVNTNDAVNESSNLIAHGGQLLISGEVTRYPEPSARTAARLPLEIEGLLEYVPSVRLGLSARRRLGKVQERGAKGLWRVDQASGLAYKMHSQNKSKRQEAEPITGEDVHAALKSKAGFHGHRLKERHLDSKDDQLIAGLIERAFKD